jgi:hypothetical protein
MIETITDIQQACLKAVSFDPIRRKYQLLWPLQRNILHFNWQETNYSTYLLYNVQEYNYDAEDKTKYL